MSDDIIDGLESVIESLEREAEGLQEKLRRERTRLTMKSVEGVALSVALLALGEKWRTAKTIIVWASGMPCEDPRGFVFDEVLDRYRYEDCRECETCHARAVVRAG